MLYEVITSENLNIFSIAAMAGLPYETIATFNRIPSADSSLQGKLLLLPSQPGIYLPENPSSDLEYIALSWRSGDIDSADRLDLGGSVYYFFPGASFHDVERAYFLSILFIDPLPKGIVSSGYGLRKSPFTGHDSFHNGIV